MAQLLSLENIFHAYGPQPLLDHIDLRIESGERVCLLGRNGEGKSTLMKIVTGELAPDAGTVRTGDAVRVAYLPQSLPEASDDTVYHVVVSAFPETGELLEQFEALSHEAQDEASLAKLEKIQERIEALDGWSLHQRVGQILEQFQLAPEAKLAELSGGWQRRALLARALVTDPDLLLLDEPTNHLDVPAIRWLENTLANYRGAVFFISHDRAFIRSMATRIVELDRGHLTSWPGDYDRYFQLKEKALEDEERHNAEFDRKLAQEEAWIRQGIKARRTRNMGRVRELKAMREAYKARRERIGTSQINVEEARQSGKLVADAEGAGFAYPGQPPLIKDLNLLVLRGDKLGFIGENGSGKTTLLKLLLGDLEPTEGVIKLGTQRSVAYFDQLRDELDLEKNALDNLAEGREYIEINGQKKHVLGYLQDFLFTPQRARTPVRVLSGGERARLMLAKLFSKPANILVLDEPTNDLDVDTLELLEAQLVAFSGTVILISHDRAFLDNVVTSTLFLDGSGRVESFVGGYEDWRRQGGRFPSEVRSDKPQKPARKEQQEKAKPVEKPRGGSKKLSYKLKLELEQLPEKIAHYESLVEERQAKVNDPDFYQQDHETINRELEALSEAQAALEGLMERWLELEEMTEQ
ncbi:ATP-binding cassette domain-containing protein [Marinobacteraceae bacterium S3BR75-40.1]